MEINNNKDSENVKYEEVQSDNDINSKIKGDVKNFFQILFDFSFKEFVTPQVIKVVYVLSILFSALISFSIFEFGLDFRSAFIKITLSFMSVVVFFMSVLFTRMFLEAMVCIYKIEEHARKIADK